MLSTQPTSVMVHSSPELSLPAPVQNKHNVHRMSAVIPCEPKAERDNEFPEMDLDMVSSLPALGSVSAGCKESTVRLSSCLL